jgi:hypothetical protein
MIDDFRKGWALRYMREAEDEIRASQKSAQSFGLILDAARKAQAAVYYSLGDPFYIESLVHEVFHNNQNVQDPILRCLVDIENTLQRIENLPESSGEEAFKDADEVVKTAAGIVNLLVSED